MIIIFAFIVVNITIICLCKKYIKQKVIKQIEMPGINENINMAVSKYFELNETKL